VTSTAPLAKLSYSVLVASLITAAVLILFLATPRLDWYWWLGFVLFAITVVTVLAPVIAYRWTTRPGHRYPAAPAIDYCAELRLSPVRVRLQVAEELRRAA
jgi:hypothetical protein